MKDGENSSPCSASDAELEKKNDNELIAMIRESSAHAFNALVRRYSKAVSAASRRYFSDALTDDDWFQEGMLGLLYAVHSFDENMNASFSTYASVCIRNRLNSVWKKANNKKNAPLNESLSFDDAAVPSVESPEEDYIKNEDLSLFSEGFTRLLSKTERRAMSYYLAGYSYDETADKLGITKKSVDNALSRAKRKLKRLY